MSDLAVHPVADLFPMLAADELQELAADIAERGQLQPIILDTEGRVLDGRNRLAACEIADVEPTFETFDGEDPDGYALAVNIARRHLSTGARAMIAAEAARLGGRGNQKAAAKSADLHFSRVTEASIVLDWAPDFAPAVVAGAMPLSKAVEHARERKREAEALEAKMARLHDSAPDLLALVGEERMDVDDALAALKGREEKAAEEEALLRTQEQEQERKRIEEQRDARALLSRAVELLAPRNASDGFVRSWAEHLGELDDELAELTKRAEQAAQVLLDLTERVKQ